MALLDCEQMQAAQILLNHAEIHMIMWNINKSLKFFNYQFPVCVHENESWIVMHFLTQPLFRILAG